VPLHGELVILQALVSLACVPVGTLKIGLIAEEGKPHLTNQVVGDPRVGEQEWENGNVR
jgi:hypothetical protein